MVGTSNPFRLTVAKYNRMIEAGILTKSDRVELIRGEIVNKMSIGELHAGTVAKLIQQLLFRFANRVTLWAQSPVVLADSQPEPDILLLEFRPDYYQSAKPVSANVVLLIEVAEFSLEIDRDVKAPLYAENGVREYWIVNLNDRQIEVFRQPQPNGIYRDQSVRRPGEQIDLLACPGVMIPVDDLLP